MASMLLMYLIVTIFPTLYFVHTVNPVHDTAGHLMAGKLLIWDTTVCWTAATECYCSISLNRTKELETNLCEDLTITEKAPKYTNEAISWHWKLCGGLLQALPFSTISITGVFTVFFAHQMVAINSACMSNPTNRLSTCLGSTVSTQSDMPKITSKFNKGPFINYVMVLNLVEI